MIESLSVDPRIRVKFAKNLLRLPKTIHVQEFSEEAARDFRADMSIAHRTGQPIIPVVIDSYGGDVYALFAMIDTIKSSKLPVATLVLGKAMSSATVLFTCGSEGYRFVAPHATLMVHDVSADEAYKKAEEIKSDAKEVDRINRKAYRVMDRNCGQKAGFFWNLVQQKGRADWYLTPQEAIRLQMANHVKVPTLKTTVSVETSLEF